MIVKMLIVRLNLQTKNIKNNEETFFTSTESVIK